MDADRKGHGTDEDLLLVPFDGPPPAAPAAGSESRLAQIAEEARLAQEAQEAAERFSSGSARGGMTRNARSCIF